MSRNRRNNQNKDIENFCLTIIRWGIYLILFTPLVIVRSSFFPFVTPKTIYFRILVEIIFAAFLILAINFPQYRPKFNLLSVSLFLFVGIIILTSFLGVNPERSFWSTYERMTGIFTFLHLLLFFVVLTSVIRQREDWDKILAVSIIVGILLCFYVLLAGEREVSTRGGGTIGNTSFMAAYLLFDVFFAIILFFGKKTSGWRTFSGISLLVSTSVLLTSTARGAIVSFFGGLVLILLGYLILSEKKSLKKLGWSLIFLLISVVSLLLIYKPFGVGDGIDFLLLEMKPRFVVWDKAWKGFLERPIFGWGPENFNVVFTKFFNPCMFTEECGSEIWFDRVHNIVLDTLVTSGIVGLLSYLLIFAVSVLGLLRTYLRKREYIFPYLGMMVLLIVYFFQNLLVFDMISSYMVFFLALGFAYFLMERKEDFYKEKEIQEYGFWQRGPVKNISLVLILVLSASFLYFGNIQPANSAVNLVSMIVAQEDLEKIIDFYKESIDTFMEKYEAREQFAQKLYSFNFDTEDVNQEKLEEAFDIAEEEMEKSMKKNSLDFRPHLFGARLYFADYRVTSNPEKLDISEDILGRAVELSPANQQGYWFLADLKLVRGENDKAVEMFQKAIDLEPKYGKSHWYLAMVYKMLGEYQKALEEIKDAEDNGYRWKKYLEDIEKVTAIYDILQDDNGVVKIYKEALGIHPQEAKLWAGLAAAYANLGDFEKAREAAEKVIEIDPSLRPQVEEFLKQVEN